MAKVRKTFFCQVLDNLLSQLSTKLLLWNRRREKLFGQHQLKFIEKKLFCTKFPVEMEFSSDYANFATVTVAVSNDYFCTQAFSLLAHFSSQQAPKLLFFVEYLQTQLKYKICNMLRNSNTSNTFVFFTHLFQ